MEKEKVMKFYKINNYFTQIFSLLYINIKLTRNEIVTFPVNNRSFLNLNSKEYFKAGIPCYSFI